MEISTVSSKGQITIPKKIREFLKVDRSDKIIFTPIEEGKVIISTQSVPATALFGMLRHKKPSKPVSVEKMKKAVREKRVKRGVK